MKKYGENKNVFIILAVFLGGLGVHKFYQGRAGAGLIYVLFFWTLIPMIISIFEALGAVFSKD